MSKELKFEFNDYIIAIDEPYENDCGYVAIGKKQSNGISIVFKSPNEKTVNWFIELQKYITNLQSQLDQANERLKGAIVPKFKKDDFVYALFTQAEIYKGQIDAFDYYTNSYLVFPNEDVGNEWIKADKVFKSKAEAQAKLQELRGGE